MIEHLDGITGDELEREMFILRKLMESEKADRMSAITAEKDPKAQADAADFYICTLSNKVIVYKVGSGLMCQKDASCLAPIVQTGSQSELKLEGQFLLPAIDLQVKAECSTL